MPVGRRAVGVGRVQHRDVQAQHMRDYADRLDAEAVGRALDEVERFERRLAAFARDHAAELRRDPVLRARLKGVADAAGVDLEQQVDPRSAWAKAFGGFAGLGAVVSGGATGGGSGGGAVLKRTHDLAARVVAFCLAEARLAGSLVPLPRVVAAMRAQLPDHDVSAADVEVALAELRVFGPAYTLLPREKGVHDGYVVCQATAVAADVASLVALAVRRTDRGTAQQLRPLQSATAMPCAAPATSGAVGGGPKPTTRGFTLRSAGVSLVGAGGRSSTVAGAPSSVPAPPVGSRLTAAIVANELGWSEARAREALVSAVSQADVWVDAIDDSSWFPAAWIGAHD